MHHRAFIGIFLIILLSIANSASPADKVGNLDIRSPLFGTRVYVDDEYQGDADIFIDNVKAGDHVVTCRHAGHTVSGTFTLRENETLMLEARFDEGKIVNLKEVEKQEEEKKKAEEAAPAAPPREELKKPAVAEKKKEDPQAKLLERFKMHHTVIRAAIDEARLSDFTVSRRTNPKVVRDYAEKKNQNGKLYRNKQGVQMCEAGLCTREWAASFTYVDDAGKSDTMRLTWRNTTNWYKSPEGISRSVLEWCVSDKCAKLETSDSSNASQKSDLGRYALSWTKDAIFIRRTDIAKEITAAGKNPADY